MSEPHGVRGRRIVRVPRAAAAVVVSLSMSACSTTTRLTEPVAAASDRAPDCRVDFYDARRNPPTRPFRIVTQAESHIEKNLFFGGTAQLADEGYAELRRQACKVGADAVRIDDAIESRAGEFSHVHVWASLLQYTEAQPAP